MGSSELIETKEKIGMDIIERGKHICSFLLTEIFFSLSVIIQQHDNDK